MQGSQSEHHQPAGSSLLLFKPGPTSLLVATVAIIFVTEAFIMMLMYFLRLPADFSTGILNATILSLVVAPTLYFMLFKPMRETILKLDKAEEIQKRLEEIESLKSDFVAIATHELCTPVTAIMGYIDLLLDDLNPEHRQEYLKTIHKKAEVLERIIDDLRIINQLEKGESLQIKQAKHDLRKTVHNGCDVYQKRFPEVPINLNLPKDPLPVTYDEIRISQVLDNLLSNSIKYSKGIRDKIEVTVSDHRSHVSISIKDCGIGMTQDEIGRIYDKFFRAETKKATVGGLGLGMAIVKNIIDSHNGAIDIVSHRKVGTTVTVSLPRLAAS